MAEPFQFPAPIEGCDCTICTRQGVDMTIYREPVSIFETYQLATFTLTSNGIVQGPAQPLQAHDFDDFYSKNPKIHEWLMDSDLTIRHQPWYKVCSTLLRKLLKQKESKTFKDPVDYITLNIPEYPKWVRHPMDLGTIDRRLHNEPCIYTNPDDFVSDVRLVFRNAFLFNPEGHPVRTLSQVLSKMFEDDLQSYAP